MVKALSMVGLLTMILVTLMSLKLKMKTLS